MRDNFEFTYSHVLPKKAPIVPTHEPQQKFCIGCRAGFIAPTPNKVRCDACQKERVARQIVAANQRAREKRRKARAAGWM